MNSEAQSNSAGTGASSNSGSADLEKADLDTVYISLATSSKGLTSADAKERLDKYGRNELVDQEISNLMKFLAFFWGPIAWMIEAAALLSLLMQHWADFSIIMVLLLYNAISGFWQELKAS
ncbi:MAG: metal-transporting ATPase, partial [Gammaproteobacteria bacterium]